MTIQNLHQLFLQFPIISTDTRKIEPNSIFFALKGANFNGNKYASEALKNGAAYAIIDEKEYEQSDKTIYVEDTLRTLQKLANYHRNHNKAKIIALTGSNGKTTTKELISQVISTSYKTIATVGNFNNHIGVPLTLLTIKPETEIAVIEMGANHHHEIAFLCKIAEPDFGYITNFGKAHLEGFGSVEGVIEAKSELYDFLISNNKGIFLNADDPIQLKKLNSHINKFGYSTSNKEYYQIEALEANPMVKVSFENTTVQTNLIGTYNFSNCCAAIVIGKYFNVPLQSMKKALESYVPSNNRSQIIQKGTRKIILDAYNANPSSMKVALENFSQLNEPNKVVFLGDMFELGDLANKEHQEIAELCVNLKLENTFLVGEHFFYTNTKLQKLKTFENLLEELNVNPISEDITILIKGSRGMALERILDHI